MSFADQSVSHAARLRTLTELDHVRLRKLLDRIDGDRAEPLLDALDQSQLVQPQEVAQDVVTMYTRVRVQDVEQRRDHVYTLCYPADAEPASGFISVLSPIGAALLGARLGEQVTFTRPDGRTARLELIEILFQPEASGDYTT
jgi:regulator of nucleoside diphosphate kinase